MRSHMRSKHRLHTQLPTDDERARQWLKRRLDWEEILVALRDASRGDRPAPARQRREPAAA